MDKKDRILIGIFVIGLLIMGWLSNEVYDEYKYKRILNGLYLRDSTYQRVNQVTEKLDSKGDWTCVNVRGMSFEEAVETCQHESAHEIFAEIIENHPEKIKEVMEVIENE